MAGCLVRFVPCSCEPLIVMTLRLLFNLSFDPDIRYAAALRPEKFFGPGGLEHWCQLNFPFNPAPTFWPRELELRITAC